MQRCKRLPWGCVLSIGKHRATLRPGGVGQEVGVVGRAAVDQEAVRQLVERVVRGTMGNGRD